MHVTHNRTHTQALQISRKKAACSLMELMELYVIDVQAKIYIPKVLQEPLKHKLLVAFSMSCFLPGGL